MQTRSSQGKTTLRRLFLLAAILAVGSVVWFMLGDSESLTAEETPGQKVLARVDGTVITETQITEAIAGQLLKLKRDRHDLIERTVDAEIRKVVLANAASERGISTEELLKLEATDKAGAIPAAEVDAFYEARKAQIRQPKESVEERIRQILASEAFYERLEGAAEIEKLTEPFRVEVAAVGPSKGPENAPVTIVEFSDFECPYCGRVNPSIRQIEENYGDRVKIVFRQFPLSFHPNAQKAGEASLCADEQGKFWQMHDSLFGNQKNLGVEGLKGIAAEIADLDPAAFNACLDSGKHAETVSKDVAEGSRAGVSGTPAFFINGRFLSGAQPYETFAEIIDDELKSAG